jgi:hypothetical protein
VVLELETSNNQRGFLLLQSELSSKTLLLEAAQYRLGFIVLGLTTWMCILHKHYVYLQDFLNTHLYSKSQE